MKSLSQSLYKQKGIGFWGLFFIIPMVGFIGFIGVKLSTPYMEYLTIRSAIENVASRDRVAKPSHSEIRREIQKILLVNEVRFLKKENMLIKKKKDGTHIIVNYVRTIPMYGNVDALLTFDYDARIK